MERATTITHRARIFPIPIPQWFLRRNAISADVSVMRGFDGKARSPEEHSRRDARRNSTGRNRGMHLCLHFIRLLGCAPLTVAAALALSGRPGCRCRDAGEQNLTQLITQSDSIISGKVERVTDGINENGMPYTEITIAVTDAAKGSVRRGSTYTFRQFGLMKPRSMPNGKVLVAVTPDGFPQWAAGERVVAFLTARCADQLADDDGTRAGQAAHDGRPRAQRVQQRRACLTACAFVTTS